MTKPRILFICTHNSARSQMAEAYLRQMAGDSVEVYSAGFDPGPIQPLAVEVMAEDGLDISGARARSVFDLYRQGRLFDYVITVCQNARETECPVFPGVTQRLHWPFPNPADAQGAHQEKLAAVRDIRDSIKSRVRRWWDEVKDRI
jgi:arsenate reductase (thioredoxin)